MTLISESYSTCGHVDKDTIARLQVGHLKQHQVGSHVANRQSCSFLEAHLVRHDGSADGGHDNQVLPQAAADQRDDAVSYLRGDKEEIPQRPDCGKTKQTESIHICISKGW